MRELSEMTSTECESSKRVSCASDHETWFAARLNIGMNGRLSSACSEITVRCENEHCSCASDGDIQLRSELLLVLVSRDFLSFLFLSATVQIARLSP